MKKRTFKVVTDYVTVSPIGAERVFDNRRFISYVKGELPNAASAAMSAEGIAGNPRFKRTNLQIKNIEVGFRDGRNAAGCPTRHIKIYFDTYTKEIPFSLRLAVKEIVAKFDPTLAPSSMHVVAHRVF